MLILTITIIVLTLVLSILSIPLFAYSGRNFSLRSVRIDTEDGEMKALVLRPQKAEGQLPSILWIHGSWRHYLGEAYGTETASKYASPARETDYSNLPATPSSPMGSHSMRRP